MGAAGLSDGRSVYPGRNSYHVDRDCGKHMLQVRFGKSPIAGVA